MSSRAGHKVPNPYAGNPDYHCFGCDPDNPVGLRLQFYRDGERIISSWEPRADLEGYPGVTHGGILATLADEVGAWYLHVILGTAGMTRELNIVYHAPARAGDGPFRLETGEVETTPKSAIVTVSVRGASGTLLCTARCVYALFSEAVARRRFDFPGREAFLPG